MKSDVKQPILFLRLPSKDLLQLNGQTNKPQLNMIPKENYFMSHS
jgi:hypothetical protein